MKTNYRNLLYEFQDKPSRKIEAIQSQSATEHIQLLDRLDELTRNLNELEPPFDSWQATIDQLEWFVDALECHEEQESASIEALMPDHG